MNRFRYLAAGLGAGCWAAIFLSACASAPVVEPPEPGETAAAWSLAASDLSTRRLYRVSYSGQEGRGTLRVVMVLYERSSYSLSASDTFGRSVWDLRIDPEDSWLIDHRQSRICRIDNFMALPGDTLEIFSLQSLPFVLLGRLPVRPASQVVESPGQISFLDETGRDWSATLEGSEVSSWTLRMEGEPRVWWTRQPRGGILSHRRGSQLRWKEVVVEPLDASQSEPELPSTYQRVHCDESDLPELRQDQPPSPGVGPT